MEIQSPFNEAGSSLGNWKSLNSNTLDDSENISPCGFECNICLELVHDPVVTFCGHLFCWPCIYLWITSSENPDHQKPQCPVCKTDVSHKTLIPLYGRGQSGNTSNDQFPQLIPQRPLSPSHTSSQFQLLHSQNYAQSPQPRRAVVSPMPGTSRAIGMIGEMVFAGLFGNSDTNLYAHRNSYHFVGNGPRVRRHMMRTDKSLSRVFFFLCCCVILCLLCF